MKKQRIPTLIAFIITVVLISFFLSQIGTIDLINTVKKVNPIYIVFGFILYLGSNICRAYRFYILLDKEVNVKDLFYVVCVHNLANNILPARTGELSYVYILKKIYSRNTSEGIASLTVVRFFDFITIFFLFFLSVSHIQIKSNIITNNLWPISFFMIFLIILFLTLFFYGNLIISNLKIILQKLSLDNKELFMNLLRKLEEIPESFEKMKPFGKTIFFELVGLSFGVWITLYLFNYILMKSLNINFDFLTVVFSTSFAVFTNILPVQGIGGFGTLEGGWSAGLIAAGLDSEVAICSAFIFHIISIVYYLLLGFLGLFGIKSKNLTKNIFNSEQLFE